MRKSTAWGLGGKLGGYTLAQATGRGCTALRMRESAARVVRLVVGTHSLQSAEPVRYYACASPWPGGSRLASFPGCCFPGGCCLSQASVISSDPSCFSFCLHSSLSVGCRCCHFCRLDPCHLLSGSRAPATRWQFMLLDLWPLEG